MGNLAVLLSVTLAIKDDFGAKNQAIEGFEQDLAGFFLSNS